jgi:hypothetical protein
MTARLMRSQFNMVPDARGDYVHYSDYEKLRDALRQILRSAGTYNQTEIAEAALLSAGEEL